MGYAPQIPFSEGLRATVDWYRDNRWWWQPLKGQPAPLSPAAGP
jgi:dTDP-glucose 4,6-dehydratase